jgi:hypothetical protein
MSIRCAALTAFIVFLGSPAWGQPGPATLISPSSDVTGSTVAFTWHSVRVLAQTGLRGGWRMPTIAELRTLTDFTRTNPSLPTGHPFVVPEGYYWSLSPYLALANYYYIIEFNGTIVTAADITTGNAFKAWCLRGGASAGH